jgi:hypothetical protein
MPPVVRLPALVVLAAWFASTLIPTSIPLGVSCCDAGASCSGARSCKVCTNCSRCAHCKGGGSCGVCSRGSSTPDVPPPADPTPVEPGSGFGKAMPSGPVGSRAASLGPAPRPATPVFVPDRSFVARNGGFATILRDRTPAAESRAVLDEYIRKEMAGDLAGQARDVKLGRVVMLPAQTRFEILSIEEPDPAGGEAATFEFHREHPAGEVVKINIVGGPKSGSTLYACRADVGRMVEAPAGSVGPDDPAASQVRIAVPRSAEIGQGRPARQGLGRPGQGRGDRGCRQDRRGIEGLSVDHRRLPRDPVRREGEGSRGRLDREAEAEVICPTTRHLLALVVLAAVYGRNDRSATAPGAIRRPSFRPQPCSSSAKCDHSSLGREHDWTAG